MAQALEKHQQTQQQWLVDISHELRTPLAILRGEIEAMQDGVRTVTRQGLDSLHLEVMHLGRIVRDLHDLSLIESRNFSSEPAAVNPLEILTETLECFRTRLNQRGIRLDMHETIEGDILILADADRLKQVFSNLLENTLRYAKVPGVLKISLEAGSGEFSVSFEDSGPGVPEESLALLFDRLYRVDSGKEPGAWRQRTWPGNMQEHRGELRGENRSFQFPRCRVESQHGLSAPSWDAALMPGNRV